MRDKADRSASKARLPGARDIAPYALVIGAVVLGWQIAIQPFLQRAPVEMAVGLAPGSPLVLRRAAEAELAAGRNDNAASLARDALGRAPFDVRALRIVGLTEARAGRTAEADDLLTLAGNWSLRDDPAHAWLVEHRLRRGDYASAFAHADTLIRRRADVQPQVFRLFTMAAVEDPERVLPVLTRLLAANPPWRSAYLNAVYGIEGGLAVAASLAVMLQPGRAPLSNPELQQFYGKSLEMGQIGILQTVRARLNRPRADSLVTNGGFEDATAPEPFQWALVQKVGAVAQITANGADQTNSALRVEYDGYSAANIARQRTFLTAGRYRLRAESKVESGDPAGRMEWSVTCDPGGQELASAPAVSGTTIRNRDGVTTTDFSVPAACPSQWLELRGLPLDRRAPMVVWFDRVSIAPVNAARN